MTLYIRDPEISMRKFQEAINNFSKMVGGNQITKKSVAFLNINSKYAEKEIVVYSFYKSLKENKTSRNKPNQGHKRFLQ